MFNARLRQYPDDRLAYLTAALRFFHLVRVLWGRRLRLAQLTLIEGLVHGGVVEAHESMVV